MMSYFDLHCDTLSAASRPGALWGGGLEVDLRRIRERPHAQVYALYTANERSPQEGCAEVEEMLRRFVREAEFLSPCAVRCREFTDLARARDCGKIALILSLENAKPLEADEHLFDRLCDEGLWLMTLTHNGGNAFAEGTYGDKSRGLTARGYELVRQAEKRGVALDISHLNDRGIEELLTMTEEAVLASHSNCRALCRDERNLPDEFILELIARGGLIGLTLHRPFIGLKEDVDSFVAHIEHVVELGGEDAVALGTDFDGTDNLVKNIQNNGDFQKIADRLSYLGYNKTLIEKILYKNAYHFFKRWRKT